MLVAWVAAGVVVRSVLGSGDVSALRGEVGGRHAELASKRPRKSTGVGEAQPVSDAFHGLTFGKHRARVAQRGTGTPGHRRNPIGTPKTADQVIWRHVDEAGNISESERPTEIAIESISHASQRISGRPRWLATKCCGQRGEKTERRRLNSKPSDITRLI